ncbi:MAG: SDR family oxidoreductase [Bdellovibrionales bacterium]
MNLIVTGASRGIGLELVAQALQNKHQVLAVVRSLKKSPELEALMKKHGDLLQTCEVDVTDPEAPAKLIAAAGQWPQVDLLINNAGVFNQGETQNDLMASFQVNTIAPFLLTKELLPLLKKSKAAKVVHLTSKMGSIDDNTSGGYYAYRSSKAALNMINKSFSIDNPWLATVVIHPGWVKTDMGGSGAPTEISESASGIWQVISKLQTKDSGRFFDFKGQNLPW